MSSAAPARFPVAAEIAAVAPAPAIDYSYLIREHDIAIPSTMPPDTTAKDLPTTVEFFSGKKSEKFCGARNRYHRMSSGC